MTNFNGASSGPITRERVLLWGPALLGGSLAAVTGALLLLPLWQGLQQQEQQLQDLQAQQQRLPLLRRQLLVTMERRHQAEQRQRRILELIQGSGDLRTFLGQLSRDAQASGVQLEGYEPLRGGASTPAAGTAGADPLQALGLRKTSLLLRARGTGPELQVFLRRLESLGPLVLQSHLSLKLDQPEPTSRGKPAVPPSPGALLSLNLAFYGPRSDAALSP